MKVSASYRDIIRLTVPLCMAMLVPQLNFFTNTAFLGRLGEEAVAVNGIAGIFQLLLSMIGYGLSSGIQVMLSRRSGEADDEGLTRQAAAGIRLTLITSVVLILLGLLLGPWMFRNSLADPHLASLAGRFVQARVWGLPFLMLTQLLNALCIATGRARYIMWGSAAAALVNIGGDWALIFGRLGLPALGIQGAAVASCIAEGVGCGVMLFICAARGLFRQYPVHRYARPDWPVMRTMLGISSPLIVQYFFSIAGWQVFFIYVEHLGQAELAASQILRSAFGWFGIFTWAFAATSNMMVSNLIGQGNAEGVPALVRKIAVTSLLFTLGISVILLPMARPFLTLYRDDPALVELALPSLRVIILAAIIMSMSTVVFNGVAGTGRTMINLAIEVTCVVLYLVYCTIVIEKQRMGLTWAWLSEFVYWTSLLAISLVYLRSGRWKGKTV